MNKINTFLTEHGTKLILVLLLLTYTKSCSINSDVEKLKKEFKTQSEVVNSLPTRADVQIEALKAEKRMIQATDRKMLDVQRQNEIEKEISALQDSAKK